jgi:hypothetical protein
MGRLKEKFQIQNFQLGPMSFMAPSPEGRVFNLQGTLPPGLNGTYNLISDDQINFS